MPRRQAHTRPASVHPNRHTAIAQTPKRAQRHRDSTTAATPAAPTVSAPAGPAGTGTDAPGIPAAQRATFNSHHSSGPVNRISSAAPAGHNADSAAAAVPITVIGAITTGDREVGHDRHHAERARDGRHQRRRHELGGDGDAHRVRQRLGPTPVRPGAATTPGRRRPARRSPTPTRRTRHRRRARVRRSSAR